MRRTLALLVIGFLLPAAPSLSAWDTGYHLTVTDRVIRDSVAWDGGWLAVGGFESLGPYRIPAVAYYKDDQWRRLGENLGGSVEQVFIHEGNPVVFGRLQLEGQPSDLRSDAARWTGEWWEEMGDLPTSAYNPVAAYQEELYLGAYRWAGEAWDRYVEDFQINDLLLHDGLLLLAGNRDEASPVVGWNGSELVEAYGGLEGAVSEVIEFEGKLVVRGYFSPTETEDYPVRMLDADGWVELPELSIGWHPRGWSSLQSLQVRDGAVTVDRYYYEADLYWSYSSLHRYRLEGDSWVLIDTNPAPDPNPWPEFPPGAGLSTTYSQLASGPRGLLLNSRCTVQPDLESTIRLWDGVEYLEVGPSTAASIYGPVLGQVGSMTWLGERIAASWTRYAAYPYYEEDNTMIGLASSRSWAPDRWDAPLLEGLVEHDGRLYGIDTREDEGSAGRVIRFDVDMWSFAAPPDLRAARLLSHDGELYAVGTAAGSDAAVRITAYGYEILDRDARIGSNALGFWNGRLIAAGRTVLHGVEHDRAVAAWDGAAWSVLAADVGGEIGAMAAYAGDLYVAGEFSSIDGVPAANVARWDGAAWHALGAGLDDRVSDIEVYDGALWCVGPFKASGDLLCHHLAIWRDDAVPVEEPEVLPQPLAFDMSVAPNPFNPAVTVTFSLDRPGPVELAVYDLSGRRVRLLVHDPLPSGLHQVQWDGCDDHGRRQASGVYHARLEAGNRRAVRTMSLVK